QRRSLLWKLGLRSGGLLLESKRSVAPFAWVLGHQRTGVSFSILLTHRVARFRRHFPRQKGLPARVDCSRLHRFFVRYQGHHARDPDITKGGASKAASSALLSPSGERHRD